MVSKQRYLDLFNQQMERKCKQRSVALTVTVNTEFIWALPWAKINPTALRSQSVIVGTMAEYKKIQAWRTWGPNHSKHKAIYKHRHNRERQYLQTRSSRGNDESPGSVFHRLGVLGVWGMRHGSDKKACSLHVFLTMNFLATLPKSWTDICLKASFSSLDT